MFTIAYFVDFTRYSVDSVFVLDSSLGGLQHIIIDSYLI